MREFTILKFFDRFKGLFLKIGIDYSVLRTILQVKLTMDQRKLPTIFSQSNQRKERR
jgi:ABC-2 type transport system permease protein